MPVATRSAALAPLAKYADYRSAQPMAQLDYSANVCRQLAYTTPDDGRMRFGLELEINAGPGDDVRDLLRAAGITARTMNRFIAKRDGSVPRGVEFVTLPLLFEDQMELVTELLPLPASTASNCGVHIHMTRTAVENHIWGMYQFICNTGETTQKFIDAVVRRAQNSYCRRTYSRQMPTSNGHYEAVSLSQRHPTVEFRLFATTNDPMYLRSYVQFLEALHGYVDQYGDVTSDLAFVDYMMFVSRNAGRYHDLYTRIRNNRAFARFRDVMTADQLSYFRNVSYSVPTYVSPVTARPQTGSPEMAAEAVLRTMRRPGRTGERRTRSQVPTTQAVATWLRNEFGQDADIASIAREMRTGRTGLMAVSQRRFVAWYSANCFDNGQSGVIVTQRGVTVTGSEIRPHALYHLSLVV